MYTIGLDVGVGSVGYCVLDERKGLVKYKNAPLMGVRTFSEASTAKNCRMYRGTRRRRMRKRQRIMLLREFMSSMVESVDSNFYVRLNESFLWKVDKSVKANYILFDDKKYTDIMFYKEYPTIYHLRKWLLETDEKADPRMIYLALHHMLKYRGNFLYEGQKFEEIDSINECFINLIEELHQVLNKKYEYKEDTFISIQDILKKRISNSSKKEEIINILLKEGWEKNYATEIVKAMLGQMFNLTYVFEDENLCADDGKALKIKFDDSKYEEKETELKEILEERFYIIEYLKQIYSWVILQEILNGAKYISQAMVEKYTKHHEQLEELKELFREYVSREEYNDFFRKELKKDKKYIANYANYIKGTLRCQKSDKENEDAKACLYKEIKRILGKKAQDDIRYKNILELMEEKKYLEKLNEVCNAHIPYQLNEIEMGIILEKQGVYYSELKENKDRILQLLKFRIPYYIGPLNPYKGEREFAWIKKMDGKENEKIYPWNFDEVVDVDSTAEEFITRMTYLPEEKVVPKKSLLYEKYELLQELNKITINGKQLGRKDRDRIIDELFKVKKEVKDKDLKVLLSKIMYVKTDGEYIVKGYQDENKFASSLSSYITFSKILGSVDSSNEDMIEEIIYWLTVFEDASIIKKKIKKKYSNRLSVSQINQIAKLKYSGWGRFSRKFLLGIKGDMGRTIMDILNGDEWERYNCLPNLMQIINCDEKFEKIIEDNRIKYDGTENLLDIINDLYTSPATKRGIWQSMQVIEEIIQIMGEEPSQIFIEFARGEGEKIRTSTRKAKLEKAFKVIKNEVVDEYNQKVVDELKKYDKRLDEEKAYLYFIQNGKCLYSAKELDFNKLYEYEVDHIIPLSISDDDSLDNKALVLKKMNQDKSNRLVREAFGDLTKNKAVNDLWNALYKAGMLSEKKLDNLRKENIGEVLTRGFINRQLVETRQIVKTVANLIKDYYQERIEVVEIKAELSSNLRKKYTFERKNENGYYEKRTSGYMFYKNRELNDFHHAHDAYLTAIIGLYIQKVYPNLKNEIKYGEYNVLKSRIKKYYDENKDDGRTKKGLNFILGKFDKDLYDENENALIWNGTEVLDTMKKVFTYRNYFVSRKVEENTGAFYKETPCPCAGNVKLAPFKKGLDTTKYGGYTGENSAYNVLVRYSKRKKKCMEFIGVPIYVAKEIENGKVKLTEYLQEKLQVENLEILRSKIQKYQCIEDENGNRYYLVGPKEVINAKQLVLGGKYQELNRTIAYLSNGKWKEVEREELLEELTTLYNFILEKIDKEFPAYAQDIKKIHETNAFETLSLEDKVPFVLELLKLTRANSENPSLKSYDIKGIPERPGRKNSFSIKNRIVLIDKSVTGVYERRRYFELEDSGNTKSRQNKL